MSDVITFPGSTPFFEVDFEMFERIAQVTPAPFGRILLNRSFDIVDTDRYKSVDPDLVLRQFRPLISSCMEYLEGDLLEFDYDRRVVRSNRVQRSAKWHFDSKASSLLIGETTEEDVKNAIAGMTTQPTLVATGELPATHELVRVLNARPRHSRSVVHGTVEKAIAANGLELKPVKVGWASLLPGDALHKGNPNLTREPIPRAFFRVKEV